MSWHYLLTRQTVGEEIEFAVREAYVGPDGGLSWTNQPIRITGDSVAEVELTLQRIRRDIRKHGVLDIPPLDLLSTRLSGAVSNTHTTPNRPQEK